ncbi:MAG: DUF3237 family protein [Gemmatimonadetes bacterium]|nr:DUF3237 family protein [Gemmatimonadota bacterium]
MSVTQHDDTTHYYAASSVASPQHRLALLYKLRFAYPEAWSIPLTPDGSGESQLFFFAEGRCEGRITGRMRGANHPRRRSDGTFLPDFQGIIETDDGAVIFFDHQGYGRTYPAERRQIVSSATHLSGDERYRWLNDVVCVGSGEVRSTDGRITELVLEVMELIWQPPHE